MNESQLRMNAILHEIRNNSGDEITFDSYGTLHNFFSDEIVDKYSDVLPDVNDLIYLVQWCNGNANRKVEELIKKLPLTDYQRKKYELLKSKNSEINDTINFRILVEKYSFLDDILDMIVTDINVQDQILSLSDERLKLFKLMYLKINEMTDYPVPYISTILRRIGYVSFDENWQNRYHFYDDLLHELDDFVKNGGVLSEKEINTLLYLCTSPVKHAVPSFDEMKKFGDADTIDQVEFGQMLDDVRKSRDLHDIKFLLLSQIYGLDVFSASQICSKYDISGIEITNENKDVLEMYMAIYQIVSENDSDVLIELYDEFMKQAHPKPDFRRIIVFENDLRKIFAHDLSSVVYSTDNKPYELCEGIKVYDAGTDFKMVVTAIGAYQPGFTNPENYSEYWNAPYIRSHFNCCSLIGNSNLSLAKVKNVIFGFSTMSDNMLLLSGTSDINSTPDSMDFSYEGSSVLNFMCSDLMLDNTRGDYNELVYERRDLSGSPRFYKKNPDYIVFVEEYEDFDLELKRCKPGSKVEKYLLMQKANQERRWRESLKAARDFDVPIVKINREKVAKSEISIIADLVSEFYLTKDESLLYTIITRFENNRVGNSGRHALVREKYFSKGAMHNILSRLKVAINQIDDISTKTELFTSLYNVLVGEQQKVEKAGMLKRSNGQESGINFRDELASIESILSNLNPEFGRKK